MTETWSKNKENTPLRIKLTFSYKVMLTSCRPTLRIIHHTLYKDRLNNNNIIIEKQIQFTEVKILLFPWPVFVLSLLPNG